MTHPAGQDYTEGYHTAFAIAPKPSAFLSFFASLLLLWDIIVRNPARLRRLYHRTVLAMTVNAVIASVFGFWGTWAMPSDAPGITAGTVATCTFQGFMIQFSSFAVSFYYTSLGAYACVAIRNNFRQEKIQWMEKWIHVCVYAFPLASSIVLAVRGYFNPAGAWCWIENYPMGCGNDPGDVECTRGGDSSHRNLLAGVPMILLLVLATGTMVAVYFTVKNMDVKFSATAFGKNKAVEEARKRRSLMARRQAIVYLAVFYITALPSIIVRLIQIATGVLYVKALLVGVVLMPLQGFLNLIVYSLLLLDRRNSTGSSVGMWKASLLTRCHFGMSPESIMGSGATKTTEGSDDETRLDNEIGFSIFDGTNAKSSPWAQYLDPDSDSDHDHSDEIDRCKDAENGEANAISSPEPRHLARKDDDFCNESAIGKMQSTNMLSDEDKIGCYCENQGTKVGLSDSTQQKLVGAA